MKTLWLLLFAVPGAWAQLAPILDCVEYDPSQQIVTAHWGYVNTGNDQTIILPGPANFFRPGSPYQNQPISFEPNVVHHNVFTNTFKLSETATSTWTLQQFEEIASNDPTKYCGSAGACWDTNANGSCDSSEDTNGDGMCDPRDCQGRTGLAGATGATGPKGPAGPVGPAGPPGISPAIRVVTAASTTQSATAACKTNEVLLNGGGTCTLPKLGQIGTLISAISSSAPSGSNGWMLTCSVGQATAVALCSPKQ